MRTIGTLPPDLCRMIFRAGRRKVVLVEGKDDVETFEQWFPNLKSKLLFYDCSGKTKVEDWLNEIISDGRYLNVFGIRDRDLDFPNPQSIQQCYDSNCKGVRLYVTRQRNLENYLVAPQLLFDFFKAYDRDKFECRDVAQLEVDLLKIGKNLIYVTAANMVIHDVNKSTPTGQHMPTEFSPGAFYKTNKANITRATASVLAKSQTEITRLINPKINMLNQTANSLDRLNQFIDGKGYLVAIKAHYNFTSDANQFYNLLCDRIPSQNKIPDDIKYIVEERILDFS